MVSSPHLSRLRRADLGTKRGGVGPLISPWASRKQHLSRPWLLVKPFLRMVGVSRPRAVVVSTPPSSFLNYSPDRPGESAFCRPRATGNPSEVPRCGNTSQTPCQGDWACRNHVLVRPVGLNLAPCWDISFAPMRCSKKKTKNLGLAQRPNGVRGPLVQQPRAYLGEGLPPTPPMPVVRGRIRHWPVLRPAGPGPK